jgi:hypothetical protein
MNPLKRLNVYIFRENRCEDIDMDSVRDYLKQLLPSANVQIKGSLFSRAANDKKTVNRLAHLFRSSKISDPWSDDLNKKIPDFVVQKELDYERKRIEEKTKSVGYLYEGYSYSGICGELLSREELRNNNVNIVITAQLIGTKEINDDRVHLRVAVFSNPSVISVSGMVEAPAKPREYYLLKKSEAALGVNVADGFLKSMSEKFLDYGDSRFTDVAKGYFVQTVFHSLTGYPFCENKGCRLFNAHWQQEMIESQLNGEDFCDEHRKEIESWNRALVYTS